LKKREKPVPLPLYEQDSSAKGSEGRQSSNWTVSASTLQIASMWLPSH
jgi:hypothetical protein